MHMDKYCTVVVQMQRKPRAGANRAITMAFHPDKCTVLTITQKKTPFKHDYILHNHILEPVTSAKYLGVTLQSNLKWNTHIDNITSNGNKIV
jgi:hypothetical protein